MDELEAGKARIKAALGARIARDSKRRRRSRIAAGLLAVPLVAGAITGGFAILGLTDQQKNYTAICYLGSTADSEQREIGYALADQITGYNPDGTPILQKQQHPESIDAVQMCASLWQQGPATGSAETGIGGQLPAPELVACIRDDWRYAVFPAPDGVPVRTEDFCPSIGMKPATIDVGGL